MGQTSTERLRDYLAQLPPQSQALLMREFERAIERGVDTVVATFVLEQLRKIVPHTTVCSRMNAYSTLLNTPLYRSGRVEADERTRLTVSARASVRCRRRPRGARR